MLVNQLLNRRENGKRILSVKDIHGNNLAILCSVSALDERRLQASLEYSIGWVRL